MDKFKSFYHSIINDKELNYSQYKELGFDPDYDEDGLNKARYGVYQNLFKLQNISFKDFILCLLYGKINQLFDNCFDEDGNYVKGNVTLNCEYAKKLHDEMEYLIPIEGKGIPIKDYSIPGNPINGFKPIEKNESIFIKGEHKTIDEFLKDAMETCLLNEKQTKIPWKMAFQLISFQKKNQLLQEKKNNEVKELIRKTKKIIESA